MRLIERNPRKTVILAGTIIHEKYLPSHGQKPPIPRLLRPLPRPERHHWPRPWPDFDLDLGATVSVLGAPTHPSPRAPRVGLTSPCTKLRHNHACTTAFGTKCDLHQRFAQTGIPVPPRPKYTNSPAPPDRAARLAQDQTVLSAPPKHSGQPHRHGLRPTALTSA